MCNANNNNQVNDIWYSAVPGDEITKTAAKQSLAREWEARFRAPSDDTEEVRGKQQRFHVLETILKDGR